MSNRHLWFFFVYLCLYLLASALHLSCATLRLGYLPLHALFFGDLAYRLARHLRKADPAERLFWLAVALIFLVPGVYLEYPSDQWEHLRRILSWSAVTGLREGLFWSKFAYFWDWSLVSYLPTARIFGATQFLSFFWQSLLAVHFYRLSLALGFDRSWSRIATLVVIFSFGTSVFSFFRNYTLSPTPLAVCAYLAALEQWLALSRTLRLSLKSVSLIPLAALMAMNHVEELLLFALSGSTLALWAVSRALRARYGLRGPLALALVLAGALAVTIAVSFEPARSEFAFTSWKIFRFWGRSLKFREAIAVPGLIGIACSFFCLTWNSQICVLLLVPYFLLQIPEFVLWFVSHSDYYTTYRLTYILPPCYGVLGAVVQATRQSTVKRGWQLAVLAAFVAIPVPRPFYGRAWFQLHLVPDSQSLRIATPLLAYFDHHREIDPKCLLAGDTVTEFLLATFYQHDLTSESRLKAPADPRQSPKTDNVGPWLKEQKFCGFLVKEDDPAIPESAVGRRSEHWAANALGSNWVTSPEYLARVLVLAQHGWRLERIPPFFVLVTLPDERTAARSLPVPE
jgi:hypothetical protein